MTNYDFKQINDPIHGSIHLSELETSIISTGVFQRLHNVKQLGLGVLVYPSANYSRFSHSIGACHLAGRIVDAINKNLAPNDKRRISDEHKKMYRLGGLLHDIGHYPFSHTFEYVVEDYYKNSFLHNAGDVNGNREEAKASYDHEKLGQIIISNDTELNDVFRHFDIKVEELKKVFDKSDPEYYLTEILSSDLDCDRLDYLMRTAHHAGLPYGLVDVNYLVHNMDVDIDNNLCLKRRALRAADHMLVSRYYDYMQLPYHKTVAAFEQSLKKVIEFLLDSGDIKCSAIDITEKITCTEWASFDDQNLVHFIRKANPNNDVIKKHIESVLKRQPPKLVFCKEKVETEGSYKELYNTLIENIESKIEGWAHHFKIDKDLWHVWKPNLSITKCGSFRPLDNTNSETISDGIESQLVRIKGIDRTNSEISKPLILCENTLVGSMADKKYYGLRVYVNLIGQDNETRLRKEIEDKIRNDIPTAVQT